MYFIFKILYTITFLPKILEVASSIKSETLSSKTRDVDNFKTGSDFQLVVHSDLFGSPHEEYPYLQGEQTLPLDCFMLCSQA